MTAPATIAQILAIAGSEEPPERRVAAAAGLLEQGGPFEDALDRAMGRLARQGLARPRRTDAPQIWAAYGQELARTGRTEIAAAALDLAYVAAGFADGFFETGLSPWDVAAGSLLVTEAGGLIGNFTGEADFLEQKECMAANPRIYGQMVGLLGKYSKFAGVEDKTRVAQAASQGTHSTDVSQD